MPCLGKQMKAPAQLSPVFPDESWRTELNILRKGRVVQQRKPRCKSPRERAQGHKAALSKRKYACESHNHLVKMLILLHQYRVGLRFCISNKIPWDPLLLAQSKRRVKVGYRCEKQDEWEGSTRTWSWMPLLRSLDLILDFILRALGSCYQIISQTAIEFYFHFIFIYVF